MKVNKFNNFVVQGGADPFCGVGWHRPILWCRVVLPVSCI